MTCTCDFLNNIKDEDDDWEIQRLEDIITICEALIKHKKRQRNKMSVEELLAKIDERTENKKENDKKDKKEKDKKDNNITNSTITTWTVPEYLPRRLIHRYPWDMWDIYTYF